MISGLRALARSFVRGAVAIGRTATETYTSLVEGGLGYIETLFRTDYDSYSDALYKAQQIRDVDKDYLVPGNLHSESQTKLTTKFKYDVTTVWEREDGTTISQSTSISANERMTQTEIEEAASDQMSRYVPEGAMYHGDYEIDGAWYK